MARVEFKSVTCSGSVDISETVAKHYEVPLTGDQAHEMSIVDVPEAGGEVKLIDADALRRITLLGAALHQELAGHIAANSGDDTELNAALTHVRTAVRWAKTAFRKNRTQGLQKAPQPGNPFPPKTAKGKPNAQRRR